MWNMGQNGTSFYFYMKQILKFAPYLNYVANFVRSSSINKSTFVSVKSVVGARQKCEFFCCTLVQDFCRGKSTFEWHKCDRNLTLLLRLLSANCGTFYKTKSTAQVWHLCRLNSAIVYEFYIPLLVSNIFCCFLGLQGLILISREYGFRRVESSQTPARGPKFEPNS
jgi:hypothetical protein